MSDQLALTRFCRGCGQTKFLSEFSPKPRHCKACRAKEARDWRERQGDRWKEYVRAYALEHRDEALARSKAWYAQNRDRAKATSQNWRSLNQLRHRAKAREWEQANPERIEAKNRRRKALRRSVPNDHYTLEGIAMRDGYTCALCGSPVDMTLRQGRGGSTGSPTIDHIVPLSRGGHDTLHNVQLAHKGCNSRKRDRV